MTFIKSEKEQSQTMKICNVILVLAIAAIIIFSFSDGISGNDFWWHVKVGEYVCENKTVPQTDIFSWYGTEKQIDWTAHEWLSDVIFYKIYNFAGEAGVFTLSLTAALTMSLMLFKEIKKKISTNFFIGAIFLLLFAVLSKGFFYGRPHLFSFFLLFAELKVLYNFYANPKSKSVFWLPIIAILWSNLHGGSANLSYILCFIFAFVGLFNVNIGKIESQRMDKKAIIKLLLIGVACILAILINPVGEKVLFYPYVNLSDDISMNVISEWKSPDAKVIGDLILFFLPIGLMCLGFLSEDRKKIRAIDLVVMVAFLFLFFRSARFIVLWYIAAVFCSFDYIPEWKIKPIKKKAEKLVLALVAVLLAVSAVTSGIATFKTSQKASLITKVAKDELIEAIKEDLPQRIYNDYNLGEALIFNDIPVFFDARADLYAQENIMADGISLAFLQQANADSETASVDAEALIQKYNFDAIVILKERPLYAYIISHTENFTCVYEDENVGYFKVK